MPEKPATWALALAILVHALGSQLPAAAASNPLSGIESSLSTIARELTKLRVRECSP